MTKISWYLWLGLMQFRYSCRNITGSYLQPISSLATSAEGNRVLMVSGSDAHGTPVTCGPTPKIDTLRCTEYHFSFLELFQNWPYL